MLLLPPEFLAQQAQQGGPLGWPMGFPPGGMPPPHMLGLHAGGFGGMGDRFAHPPPPSREVGLCSGEFLLQQGSCAMRAADACACALQKCSVDEETGDVAVRLGRTEIVKVWTFYQPVMWCESALLGTTCIFCVQPSMQIVFGDSLIQVAPAPAWQVSLSGDVTLDSGGDQGVCPNHSCVHALAHHTTC